MSCFTFHVVWMLVSVAGISAIYGGPIWAYPPAVLLATIAAEFVTAYPTDNSLRRTLAAFGGFLVIVTSSRFAMFGVTPLVINESLSVLLFGVACIWASVFPYRNLGDATP